MITYTDKVEFVNNTLPDVNQWKASDANQVKGQVNTTITDLNISISNLNTAITNLTNLTAVVNTKMSIPAVQSYVPVHTGCSVNPTLSTANYLQLGRVCMINVTFSAPGTSNATTKTITLPVAAASVQPFIITGFVGGGGPEVIKVSTRVNSAIADVYRNVAEANWPVSGNYLPILNFAYITI
jgi:hypothetical protein